MQKILGRNSENMFVYVIYNLQFKGLSKKIGLINRKFCNANYYTAFCLRILQDARR
jgi:hypothetical protein